MNQRVLIIEDHPVVRAGLRTLLDGQHTIEVVDEAGDLSDAVFKVRRHQPDLILLDVRLPDGNGVAAIERLRAEAPNSRVLILSMEADPHQVRRAFENGASGYILKDAAESDLLAAISEIASGRRYLDPELGVRVMRADAQERRRAEEDPLSDREHEVLHLLARGHTNQEIATRLFISVRTAESHRAHIMQKLRLSSRAELVEYAIELGLFDPETSQSY